MCRMVLIEKEFALQPNSIQISLMNITFDVCDEIYNSLLEHFKEMHEELNNMPRNISASRYFESVMLPANQHWKLADSRAIRNVVYQCVHDFNACKGNVDPVSSSMYPKMYKTYTKSFSMNKSDATIKIPKIGMVKTSTWRDICGDVPYVKVLQERPDQYTAIVGDSVTRVEVM